MIIGLLEWLAQLGYAADIEEWHPDSVAARILVGRLRNDQGYNTAFQSQADNGINKSGKMSDDGVR